MSNLTDEVETVNNFTLPPDDAIEYGFEDLWWPEWFEPIEEQYTGPRLPLDEILDRGVTGDSALWSVMVAIDSGHSMRDFRRAVLRHPDRFTPDYLAALEHIEWRIVESDGLRFPAGWVAAADLRAAEQFDPTKITVAGEQRPASDAPLPEAERMADAVRSSGYAPPAPAVSLLNAKTGAPLDLNWLRTQLQLPTLTGVRKLGAKMGLYELILADGSTIELGPAKELLDQKKVRAALLDGTQGRTLLKRHQSWGAVAQSIAFNASVVDCQSVEERFTDAVLHFERQSRVQIGGDHEIESAGWWSEAAHQMGKTNLSAAGHRGCVRGLHDALLVRLEALRAFLKYEQYGDFANRTSEYLTRAGFTKERVVPVVAGERVTLRLWRSKPGWGRDF